MASFPPVEDWWIRKNDYPLKKHNSSNKRKTLTIPLPACSETWTGQLEVSVLKN